MATHAQPRGVDSAGGARTTAPDLGGCESSARTGAEDIDAGLEAIHKLYRTMSASQLELPKQIFGFIEARIPQRRLSLRSGARAASGNEISEAIQLIQDPRPRAAPPATPST